MDVTPLALPECVLIRPRIFADDRGAFLETFRADLLAEATGRTMPIAQTNTSISARGVVRGVHFAEVPLGQAKYVTVARGAIVDYAIDLRVGSPDFGRWDSARLDDEERAALFIPEGFGHAFVALEDDTIVSYLVSDRFRPEREHGVSPFDSDLAIDFSLPREELRLSPKDEAAPTVADARAAGLLPDWEACRARYRELAP